MRRRLLPSIPARGHIADGAARAAVITCATVLAGSACAPALQLARDDSDTVLASHTIDAPDPTLRGEYAVRTLFYGSGTDRNRPEYRDSVAITTQPVDASKFVDLGSSAKSRNRYWGFTPKEMPLNARVWHPDGAGPFPLVLIVHGNHDMKDFSDPGYGYLGELLASRGYIFASVDMNFINGGIRGENDARGWFLLKHVEAFSKFNAEEGNPFHGRVDMSRIALIGHSRGGEAVGHAAAFNRLRHYPDDANVELDFGYDIRGIIAIAPVDGQYRPADRLVPVSDVDYLVFHGSHDGDVSSFMGLRQYQRVAFSGADAVTAAANTGNGADDGNGAYSTNHAIAGTRDAPRNFKAAVYVYRANHGQWNTVWGPNDNGPRSARILDLRGLMPPEQQRRIGEIYISSFLETSLRGDERYLPLFRDHRTAGGWLPKTMYITRYEDSSFTPVATFEEDVDVTTGTLAGVTLRGDSVGTWKEGGLNLRTANSPAEGSSLQNHAVWIGWNNRIQGEQDTTKLATPASYSVVLDDAARRVLALGASSTLEFQLLPIDGAPGPRKPVADSAQAADSAATGRAQNARPTPSRSARAKDEEKPPVDLSIEAVDANGVVASVPLSRYGAVRRPLEMGIWRRRDREKTAFARMYEMVLQSYIVPLSDFTAARPGFDPASVRQVRFVFDRAPSGTVIIDEIGFGRR
jgi:dienelactone hydrolase